MMIDFIIESELPFVVVLTKADKLSAAQQLQASGELEQELPLWGPDHSDSLFSGDRPGSGGSAGDYQ